MDVSGAVVAHGADLPSLPGATNSFLLLDYPAEGSPPRRQDGRLAPTREGRRALRKHRTGVSDSLGGNSMHSRLCFRKYLRINQPLSSLKSGGLRHQSVPRVSVWCVTRLCGVPAMSVTPWPVSTDFGVTSL